MSDTEKFIAFSYNFASDRPFVGWLSKKLSEHGIPIWFLDNFDGDAVQRSLPESRRDTRYPEDWRLKIQNWQATYLYQIQSAQGIIVVHSREARASASTIGRGMWREVDAVEYIKHDNPMRVTVVENPSPNNQLIEEFLFDISRLVVWAEEVLALPPMVRPQVTYEELASFNTKLNSSGGVQYPEQKTRSTDWYELVRLDLYDAMWFCRRCGLQSDNYILGTELPPNSCPICGFNGYEPEYDPSGFVQLSQENQEPIFKDREESLTFYRTLVDDMFKIRALSQQAIELQKSRQYDEAMKLNIQIERICRQYRNLEPLSIVYNEQARLLHQQKFLDQAVELYGHAIRICRETGDKVNLQACLGNLASILIDSGKLGIAMEMLKEQEQICRALRDGNALEFSLYHQARVLVLQGELVAALRILREQEGICRDLGKEYALKYSLALQAEILEKGSEIGPLSGTNDS